ncbi:MAG: hypothetical protein K6F47_01310 [Bacteroidaceae bacterium]|nr:hypothetical protein [Bacteroidaceae bacterium]
MVCCVLMAWADPISKQAALYTAQSYMMAKGKSINAAKKPFRAGGRTFPRQRRRPITMSSMPEMTMVTSLYLVMTA